MRKPAFTAVFCLLICLSFQSRHLSCYEVRWAVFHPVAALKINKISRKCDAIYNEAATRTQLDKFTGGGTLDAFRHSFYMAAFAQKIRMKKIRRLGIAHEKGNYRQFLHSQSEEGEPPDSLSTVMDLRNNELGFSIAAQNKTSTLAELSQLVISEIKSGRAFIMKRDRNGNYLDCTRTMIDRKKYAGVWNVPKCLVGSDKG